MPPQTDVAESGGWPVSDVHRRRLSSISPDNVWADLISTGQSRPLSAMARSTSCPVLSRQKNRGGRSAVVEVGLSRIIVNLALNVGHQVGHVLDFIEDGGAF